MSVAPENQDPPDRLVEILAELDAPTLRAVHAYVEQRLDDLRPSLQERIRSETNGRVVDIEDCEAYTLVRKYPPSQEYSGEASHRLSLYRVRREKQLNGEESLHWSYLGDVTSVECGNCGAPINTHKWRVLTAVKRWITVTEGCDSVSQSLTDHLVVPVAIAFRPRGGSRLVQLLSGDTALRLVTDTELSVIAPHDGKEVER